MLILQRRVGERIVISGGIEITVMAVTKRGVRLAVVAPRGVPVLRGEVHDAVAAANAAASPRSATERPGPSALGLTLEGTRFGNIEIEGGKVITFPKGIIGFPDETTFVLLEPRFGTTVAWLQSVKTPSLALPVVDGLMLGENYPTPSGPDLAREAGFESSDVAVLVVAVLQEETTDVIANLLAPVIVDTEKRIGAQVVLDHRKYSARQVLSPGENGRWQIPDEMPTMVPDRDPEHDG